MIAAAHNCKKRQANKNFCYTLPMADQRTVTISISAALARTVDQIARRAGRTRSELLREAFRQYAARLERWERLLSEARRALPVRKLSEGEVARIVKKHRRERAAR